MIRTQIQLDEATYKQIKRIAYEQNKSVSQVVREKLDEALNKPKGKKKKLTMADFPWVGKYHSKETDISVNHDKYLAEDFL